MSRSHEGRRLLTDVRELGGKLVAGLGRDDVEPPLDVGERLSQPIEIDRARSTDPDRGDERREALDDGGLLPLPIRDHAHHRVDLGDRGQALERPLLRPELIERGGGGQRIESRAAGAGEDAPLPNDGLCALGLQIQEVVIEVERRQGPEGEARGDPGGHEHGDGVVRDPVEDGDVDPLDLLCARPVRAGARQVMAIDDHEHRGEQGHHAEPGEQDGRARDEAELLDPPEVRQHQDVEGACGRERADQHAGSGTPRGELEGLAQAAAQKDLLLVAEEIVDAVVDPDADHDRDEHHREDAQMPDRQRDHAQ